MVFFTLNASSARITSMSRVELTREQAAPAWPSKTAKKDHVGKGLPEIVNEDFFLNLIN